MSPDPTVERMVLPLIRALRTSAAEQFALADRDPCRFPLVWGDSRPPAEFCDCTCPTGDGAAWVRLAALGPSRLGGRRLPTGCGAGQWAATVEIGVTRCDTTMLDDAGNPPDENTVTAQAEALAVDGAVLRRAVRCCQWLDDWDVQWSADALTPIGPNGGCVGAALTGVFELSECGCPQPASEGSTA